MASKSYVRWRVIGLIAACAAVAHAQTAPPFKPGLWQITSEQLIDGQKAPDMSEQWKSLPPEVRKQVEASMKQQGVDMSGGGAGNMKTCMTRESLDQGRWHGNEGSCKTDYSSRTGSLWKWRSVCTQPPSESEGEARIESPERYTVKVTTTVATSRKGQKQTSQMTANGKWLGADCGGLKPLAPPAKSAKP